MNEFLAIIQSNLKDYFPESMGVEEVIVQRNVELNGRHRQAVVVIKIKDATYEPIMGVDGVYSAFCAGKASMEEILKKIAKEVMEVYEQYGSVVNDAVADIVQMNTESIKKKICYRLVGTEGNKTLLSESPHRIIGENMALVYYIVAMEAEDGRGILYIKNCHAERLGLTEEELYEAASVNTPEKDPLEIGHVCLTSMFPSMNFSDWSVIEDDEELKHYLSGMTIFRSKNFSSATVILYPGVLERIHKALGNFAVLLFSIEEALVVPVPEGEDVTFLTYMVRDINKWELEEDMVLSDTAYLYDGEKLVPIYPTEEKKAAGGNC